jgi:hypothetical protein
VDDILVPPDKPPPPLEEAQKKTLTTCSESIVTARRRNAAVMLLYGAHLLRNGAALILDRLLERGWITHLATNGAGTIHDWEYAWLGRSTESVRENVATGTFGTWDETGRNIHLALLAGGVTEDGEGYGRALGRFIVEDGVTLPAMELLRSQLESEPGHPRSAARADLLQAMIRHRLPAGRLVVEHAFPDQQDVTLEWKPGCYVSEAFFESDGEEPWEFLSLRSREPTSCPARRGRGLGPEAQQLAQSWPFPEEILQVTDTAPPQHVPDEPGLLHKVVQVHTRVSNHPE